MSYIGRLARMVTEELVTELRHLALKRREVGGFVTEREWVFASGEANDRGLGHLPGEAERAARLELAERRRGPDHAAP